jgi:hypothetical protein
MSNKSQRGSTPDSVSPKSSGQQNEGEGNKTAARHYNEDTRKFVKDGKVEQAAKDAEKALDGAEGQELRKAEREGLKHSRH